MPKIMKEKPVTNTEANKTEAAVEKNIFKRLWIFIKDHCGKAEEGRFDNQEPVFFGMSKAKLKYFLFFLCSTVFMEFFFKLIIYPTPKGMLFTLGFAVVNALVMHTLASLFSPRANRIICKILIGAYGLWCATQFVYYNIFKTPLSFKSMMNGTRQVVGNFLFSALDAIAKNLYGIVILFLPLIFFCVFGRKTFDTSKTQRKTKFKNIVTATCIFSVILGSTIIYGADDRKVYDENPSAQYFSSAFDVKLSQPTFGVVTTLRLELQHLLFPDLYKSNTDGALTEPAMYSAENLSFQNDNVMNIDFDQLIKTETDPTYLEMHKYFSSVAPSKKNEYTGIYKDFNLIYMCCESFSSYAVDKELTPTLYKLANEGIKFENFYNPIWGVSTSDGEYVACQGLIPESGVWSFLKSSKNWIPFSLGNQFRKLQGYSAPVAYHNNTYNYYNRDKSHPNLGYDYKGLGNGLDVKETWPESDLEMMERTVPQLVNQEEKFHAYYMTVSGHMNYDFSGNDIAAKNRAAVENLDMSEECKAYLACNIELDRAMEYVLNQLEAAGKLDNTVIVMSADHYPYGMQKYNLDALAGHDIEENFELYKSSLIIWHKGDKDVTVTEPVSSMDILPTVSNMFGLEYDSRLLMGRDVFGGTTPLVIFSDRSFITDKCAYNANNGQITSFSGDEISDEYIDSIRNIVSNRFKYSSLILNKNYYEKVIPRW